MKRFIATLLGLLLPTVLLIGVAEQPAHAEGLMNHDEFNSIHQGESKGNVNWDCNCKPYDNVNLGTNPDSQIVYYQANFLDGMCVYFTEVKFVRGQDGYFHAQDFKGIIKCSGNEVRYYW